MLIELTGINKSFKVLRRQPGMKEAVKALFSRRYESVAALKDLSFSVDKGEMIGYIGPNGAGKSTTVKILSGILTPDSGQCLVAELVPWQEREKHVRHIGVVFGQRSQLWWDVPVHDSFLLLRDIYGVAPDEFDKTLDELTALLDLSTLLKTPARQLSLGQRMRCDIAAALLHRPDILFLDEPSIGLDAVSKTAVRGFIKRLNKEHGTTVILTTHDMQDIDSLTDRVLLLGHGRLLLDDRFDALKSALSPQKTLRLTHGAGAHFSPHDALSVVNAWDDHSVMTLDSARLSVKDALAHLSQNAVITDFSVDNEDLDSLIVRLYQKYDL